MSEQAYLLAKRFHETYERLAPEFGYETRKETAVPWEEIPDDSKNKRLMFAVCQEILDSLPPPADQEGETMGDVLGVLRLHLEEVQKRVDALEAAKKVSPELWNSAITI